jgi:ABC-type Fe3+-hydroxamate transport system substrate-binding protein
VFKKITIFLLLSVNLTACDNSSIITDDHNQLNNRTGKQLITSISLSPHVTELIYSAGGGNNLIGVSAYSNYPADALNKPIIGDAFHLNLELISELKPDVIFYWHNGTPVQTIEQLRSLGFNLQNIEIIELADIPKAILLIADTLKTEAEKQTAQFVQQLTLLKQSPQKLLSALIQISDQPIYTVNGSHWMSEAIEACGLHNVFTDLSQLSAAVTLESVVLEKPEVIIRLEPLDTNSQLSQWPSIPAIANQRIAVLEADHFTRPTLRTLTAIKSLCRQVNEF